MDEGRSYVTVITLFQNRQNKSWITAVLLSDMEKPLNVSLNRNMSLFFCTALQRLT